MAEFGIFFTKLKWLSIPACSIYFITNGRYGVAILAILWPIIASGLGIGGKIGHIELIFEKKLGFFSSEYEEKFDIFKDESSKHLDAEPEKLNTSDFIGRVQQKTVLLVDDNPNIHLLLKDEMEETCGCEVKTISFFDGKPAFEYFINNSENIDLVVSCITMPEMNGLELLERIKALQPDLPFIIYSTVVSGLDDSLVSLADAVIVNSSDMSEVITTIKGILNITNPAFFPYIMFRIMSGEYEKMCLDDAPLDILKDMVKAHPAFMKCSSCLVLGPEDCIYFTPQGDEERSDQIPK